MWREMGIMNSFTMEVRLLHPLLKKYMFLLRLPFVERKADMLATIFRWPISN